MKRARLAISLLKKLRDEENVETEYLLPVEVIERESVNKI